MAHPYPPTFSLHRTPAFWAGVGTLLFGLAALPPGTRVVLGSAYYLPLHMALETFAVLVAVLIFILTWVGRRDRSTADIVLGCGFLAVGLIDFSHTLSYPGMPAFVTPSGTEKAISFWLTARFIAAGTLLAVGLGFRRRRAPGAWFAAGGLAAALAAVAGIHWIVLWHADWLPRTFLDGQGLTPLKVAAEAGIVILTLGAAIAFWRRYRGSGEATDGYLAAAAWVSGLGELFFAIYLDATDLYNLLGHLFKVFGYALIYRALVVRLILEPRERAEQAAGRAQALLDAAVDGIYLVNDQGQLVECNDAFAAMLGRRRDAMAGLAVSAWNPALMAQAPASEIFDRLFRQRQVVPARHVRADGSEFDAEVAVCGVTWNHQRLLLCFSRDVTERKRTERELAQRTSQLEATNKELEEFSYSMSHDMRTPLRAVDGFSKILIEEYGPRLDDEGRRLLAVVRDNAQRMGRLIDDILRFLSIGRRKMDWTAVNIGQLASMVIAELQADNPVRRLHLQVDDLPPAWGDHRLLQLAMQNLLSNAVRFSPADRETYIEIRGMDDGAETLYSITDHGIGFDMRYAGKLFKVFEHVHSAVPGMGSGIGLAIVKRVVERHGGRVWAEGQVGRGATFHFALPHGPA